MASIISFLAWRASRSPFCTVCTMRRNSDDRLARFLRQRLDLVAQVADLVALFVDEFLPADAGQAADAARPIGIELVAEMLLEEIGAVHAMGFGQTQQAAFQRDQPAVDAVHLIDQGFDAVVVELERS